MKIAFICTGNACRSQMAEGWANFYAQGKHEIYSAGTHPSGVNSTAIAMMAELKIDLSSHTSKHISQIPVAELDYFITLCDDAAANCPMPPPGVKHLHWSTPDPLGKGTDYFRKVRDELGLRIEEFLRGL